MWPSLAYRTLSVAVPSILTFVAYLFCVSRAARNMIWDIFLVFFDRFSANQVHNEAIAMKLGTIYGAHVSSRC